MHIAECKLLPQTHILPTSIYNYNYMQFICTYYNIYIHGHRMEIKYDREMMIILLVFQLDFHYVVIFAETMPYSLPSNVLFSVI